MALQSNTDLRLLNGLLPVISILQSIWLFWGHILGFLTVDFSQGGVISPTPNLEDQVSIFISPGDWVAKLYPQAPDTHFSHLLWHAWATVGLFFSPVTTQEPSFNQPNNNWCRAQIMKLLIMMICQHTKFQGPTIKMLWCSHFWSTQDCHVGITDSKMKHRTTLVPKHNSLNIYRGYIGKLSEPKEARG
jgi:hypothetical protein